MLDTRQRLRRAHDLQRKTPRPVAPPDETLIRRRPLYFAAAALILSSILTQQPLLTVAGLLVLALAFVPEIWYRWGLRALAIDRRLATSRVAFGDTVEVALAIENRKPLPLPWLQLDDEFTSHLAVRGPRLRPSSAEGRLQLQHTVALWAYERVRRRYTIRATSRGAFQIGPITLRTTDPFGILEREERVTQLSYLLVHPLIAPMERFGLPTTAPFGERKAPHRLLEDPLRTAGTRDYIPGDEPRRIHWKATAHTGALQSKVYEPAMRHSLAIFLDVRTLARTIMGYDPALVELSVTIAASVAAWATRQGYALGMYSNGTVLALEQTDQDEQTADIGPASPSPASALGSRRSAVSLRLAIPVSSSPQQLTHVLDGLARLQPFYGLPMQEIIASEQRHLPFGATVIFVGNMAAVDVPLILALRQLKARGHAVTLLLTRPSVEDPTSDAAAPQLAGLPSHIIGGRALWHELVEDVLGPLPRDLDPFISSLRPPGDVSAATSAAPPSTTDERDDTQEERTPRALVVE